MCSMNNYRIRTLLLPHSPYTHHEKLKNKISNSKQLWRSKFSDLRGICFVFGQCGLFHPSSSISCLSIIYPCINLRNPKKASWLLHAQFDRQVG